MVYKCIGRTTYFKRHSYKIYIYIYILVKIIHVSKMSLLISILNSSFLVEFNIPFIRFDLLEPFVLKIFCGK